MNIIFPTFLWNVPLGTQGFTPEVELQDNDGAFLLDNDGTQLLDNS